jgi:hypothetical protein
MTIDFQPAPADQALAIRATAHAVDPALLPEAARWAVRGVNDTEVARALLALERGAQIVRKGSGLWYAPVGSPLNGRNVSVVVNEMIRVGLLINWPYERLIPARVHLRTWDCDGRPGTWCEVSQEGTGPIRTRGVTDATLVDCRDCLDRL